MDEFELFKARASGCAITLHDFDKLARTSGRKDEFERERRRSKRGSRHGSRRNSRHNQDPPQTDTHLDVTVEIQPASPIMDQKADMKLEEGLSGEDAHRIPSDQQALNRSRSNHRERNELPKRSSLRRSSKDPDSVKKAGSCHASHNDVSHNDISHNDVSHQELIANDEDHHDESSAMPPPAIYRVRSFTTRKGEIVSRGDSFKTCQRRNSNLLSVRNAPSFRRSSEAVTQLGNLGTTHVNSLQPGVASRRSSFTCLVERRKDSFSGGLSRSGSIMRRGPHSGSIKLPGGNNDHRSNVSLEGSVLEEEILEEEELGGDDDDPPQGFQVVVMGAAGVGKTTLVNQLMTSEYLANKENNDQEPEGETVISVVLDYVETAVHFNELSPQQPLPHPLPDAYLLIFSVTDQSSFTFAKHCISHIHDMDPRFRGCTFKEEAVASERCPLHRGGRKTRKAPPSNGGVKVVGESYVNPLVVTPSPDLEVGVDGGGGGVFDGRGIKGDVGEGGTNAGGVGGVKPPVIFTLANKQDLVRNRTVSDIEVRKLTTLKRCKRAEVSALLDLNVDEVLVDLVRWLRRRMGGQVSRQDSEEEEEEEDGGCFQRAFSALCGDIFK